MSNPRFAAIACERMRGCSFAENFVTEDRLLINSGIVTGSGIVIDRSIVFDGTQHVDFDIVSQALPASAVVRFSASQTSTGVLLGNANLISGSPADGFCVWVDANGVKATYSDGTSIETALAIDLDYTDGHIYTVTYVIGASSHTLYVDDETPDTAATTVAGPIGETTAVMVGGDGTNNFVGTIYRTRIFDATLTAGEHALFAADALTSFVNDSFATWNCDTFGNDTLGNRIWESTRSGRDLTLGDGSTASLFPTFTDYTDHRTQYYDFDGTDDYVSGWPTMPSTYTVSAAFSTDYPASVPYVQQVNDSTIEDLLTVGGAFDGQLHNLIIFEGVLEQIQLYHLEWTQLSRLWRDTFIDPFSSRLIVEGACIQSYYFEDPADTFKDHSDVDATATPTDVTWDDGLTFPLTTSELEVPDEVAIRSDEITIHVVGDTFIEDAINDYLVSKGANYSLRIWSTGPIIYFLTSLRSLSLGDIVDTVTVTCKTGEKPKFYFDGEFVGEGSATVTVDNTDTGNLYLGNDADGGNNFRGKMRKVSIYNQVLTPTEVKVLHDFTFEDTEIEGLVSSFYTTSESTVTYVTRGPVDTGFWINWGDGSDPEWVQHLGTSTNVVTAHSFVGSGPGEKEIRMTGALDEITTIDLASEPIYGDISEVQVMSSLQILRMNSTNVSGNISALSALTSLTDIRMNNTSISGDLASLSGLTLVTVLYLYTTSVSGNISALSSMTSLAFLRLYFTSISVTSDPLAAWSGIDMRIFSCSLTSTEVDDCLIQLDIAGGTGGSLDISGTNAARTSASDTAVSNLAGKGWTITVN
jgi:hypothetical protein